MSLHTLPLVVDATGQATPETTYRLLAGPDVRGVYAEVACVTVPSTTPAPTALRRLFTSIRPGIA